LFNQKKAKEKVATEKKIIYHLRNLFYEMSIFGANRYRSSVFFIPSTPSCVS